jgi:hypothetical protein
MNTILLVDKTDIDFILPISRNLDPEWYASFILKSQNNFIEPIVGEELMNELYSQKDTNTLTVLNLKLIDYIKRPLVFAMFQNSLATLWMRIENGGITKNISENQESVTVEELGMLENQFKNDFDIEKQKLIKYLDANYLDYPLYKLTNCHTSKNLIHGAWIPSHRKNIKILK